VLTAAPAAANEVRGVQWFLDHPKERAAVLKACDDNPGQGRTDANCWNANAAADKASALRIIQRGR
jgi:hypothetical protein